MNVIYGQNTALWYAEDRWTWVWFCDDHEEQENQIGNHINCKLILNSSNLVFFFFMCWCMLIWHFWFLV